MLKPAVLAADVSGMFRISWSSVVLYSVALIATVAAVFLAATLSS